MDELPMDESKPKERRIPSEIECLILRFAFYNTSGKEQVALLTVAKCVAEWLIPLIYRYISISMIGRRHPLPEGLRKYGHHVRFLLVDANSYGLESESELFALCPNAHNLMFWKLGTLPPNVVDLPITRLGLYSLSHIDSKSLDSHDTQTIQKWRSRITHLVWSAVPHPLGPSCQSLSLLPNLTYLLLGGWNSESAISEALDICPQLKVLIWLMQQFRSSDQTFVDEPDSSSATGFDDIRVVMINGNLINDWIRGVQGQDDMWMIAEREVEARRSRGR